MKKEDDIVLVANFANICRLCLQSTGAMSNIYETYETLPIKDLILYATGLEVSPDDGLPSKICHKCRYIIELCNELCTMVVRTHVLLTEAAGNTDDTLNVLEEAVNDNNATGKNDDSKKITSKNEVERKSQLPNFYQDFVGKETLDHEMIDGDNNNKNDDMDTHLGQEDDQSEDVDDEKNIAGNKSHKLDSVDNEDIGRDKDDNGKSIYNSKIDNNKCMDAGSMLTSREVVEMDTIQDHEEASNDCNDGSENELDNCRTDDTETDGNEEDILLEKGFTLRKYTSRYVPKRTICSLCRLRFSPFEKLKEHVETHYIDTPLRSYLRMRFPYKCRVCGNDDILSKKQLLMHHRKHLNINILECKFPGCKYIGKHEAAVSSHQRHHYACDFVCEVCGAKFKRSGDLKAHAIRHSGQSLACHECDRHFMHPDALRSHLNTHRPPKFKCGWRGCPRAYHTKYLLNEHMIMHTKDKLFKCHLCNFAVYYKKPQLQQHIHKHNTLRNNSCDKCDATFKDYGDFYKHRVRAHGHWLPMSCDGCNRRFLDKDKLEEHMEDCYVMKHMREYESRATLHNAEVPVTQESIEETVVGMEEVTEELLIFHTNITELQ